MKFWLRKVQLRRQVEHIGKTQVAHRFLISNFQKREYLRPSQVLRWTLNVYFLNTTQYTKNSTLFSHHFLCYILSLILEECLYSITSVKMFGICAVPHLGQLTLGTGVGLVSWPQGSHIHLLCLLPHLFFMGCYSLSCKNHTINKRTVLYYSKKTHFATTAQLGTGQKFRLTFTIATI